MFKRRKEQRINRNMIKRTLQARRERSGPQSVNELSLQKLWTGSREFLYVNLIFSEENTLKNYDKRNDQIKDVCNNKKANESTVVMTTKERTKNNNKKVYIRSRKKCITKYIFPFTLSKYLVHHSVLSSPKPRVEKRENRVLE